MIEQLEGVVARTDEKTATLLINGFGISITTPHAGTLQTGKKLSLYTYLHWNQDKGPSLFGFPTEKDRRVFLLIIECPKVGPSIAINILSNITADQFLDAISAQNSQALSSVNGIGPKTAEQMVASLKHKVAKLLSSGELAIDEGAQAGSWHTVSTALSSLSYSRQEVDAALRHLTEKYSGKNPPLDQLIRAGLSFLSKNIQ